jgi:hypothetical protein
VRPAVRWRFTVKNAAAARRTVAGLAPSGPDAGGRRWSSHLDYHKEHTMHARKLTSALAATAVAIALAAAAGIIVVC